MSGQYNIENDPRFSEIAKSLNPHQEVKVKEIPPIYDIQDIVKTPANPSTLLPLLKYYVPHTAGKTVIPFFRPDPIQQFRDFHRAIPKFIPDYSQNHFVRVDETRIHADEAVKLIREVEQTKIEEALKTYAKREKIETRAIPGHIIQETSKTIHQKIAELLPDSEYVVGKTHQVGKLTATEVFPRRRVDPLFCVRESSTSLDNSMNTSFRLAFIQAFIGRLNQDIFSLQHGIRSGIDAGLLAFSSCLKGDSGFSIAELCFACDIAFGDNQRIITGFADLKL